MTDKEIVKALECCMNGHCDGGCPFRETREHCFNLDSLIFDLINRQKAEIKELKLKNSNLTSDLSSFKNDLSSAEAEIKEWKRVVETWVEQHEKDKATIENYESCLESIEKIKAKAYKEFAERLKAMAKANEWNGTICGVDIDNLLKELVGDDK